MSRLEALHDELKWLRLKQAVAAGPAAVTVTAWAVIETGPTHSLPLLFLTSAVGLVITTLLFHRLWRLVFPSYRTWSARVQQIAVESAQLRRRIAATFEMYRERRIGEAFKRAYDLTGRSVRQLEEALAVGMFRERREIFVTAFMRGGVAVRVTASIGSPYRCSASDNPAAWASHVERLRCDELRQYHNHPAHNGRTHPSATDFRTSGRLRSVLGVHANKFRSFIICWNSAREWKVFEHDDSRRCWLSYEFDAASVPPSG